MTKRTRFWLLIALGLAVLTATALAEEPDAPSRREKLTRFIQRFDRDGDGRLSADERKELRTFLAELRGRRQPAIPQTVFPGKTDLYKLADGPAKLQVVETFPLPDEDRDKTIPLRITVPAGQKPAPLIIFCHGALGSKDGAGPLVTHWASHGHIVIQPTFGDSISLMSEKDKAKVRSLTDLVNSPKTLGHWDDRPQDVSHVLDCLDLLEREIKPLAGRIDRENIAVAGHSFGAHTTMLLSGLKLQGPPGVKPPDFRDPRIAAFVMISPQGPGKSITPESYAAMRGPMLMITGDNDGSPIQGRTDKAGPWRRKAFEHAGADDMYLLWIDGAHHGFGGINGRRGFGGAGPEAPDHVYYVKSTALAFFDAYLGKDPDARAYLKSDKLDRVTSGKAKLTGK
jgi:predicted dienelactone hydrolase